MAWFQGELELYVLLFFPVLKATGVWGAAAILSVFLASMLTLWCHWSALPARGGGAAGNLKAGGVILIGPLPIVFGTDRRVALFALIFAVIALALIFLLLIN